MDERVLCELREMKRQIQTVQSSCVEEIKSQSQRMLTEIRREVQSVVEQVRPSQPLFGLGALPPDDMMPKDRGFKSQANGLSFGFSRGLTTTVFKEQDKPRSTTKKKESRNSTARPNGKTRALMLSPVDDRDMSTKMPSDPRCQSTAWRPRHLPRRPESGFLGRGNQHRRCPLVAHGDAPPLLPVEGEEPPPPPLLHPEMFEPPGVVEPDCATAGRPGFRRVVSINENIDEISESSGETACLEGVDVGDHVQAGKGRLSLSVDVCRRSRTLVNLKPLWKMSAQDFLNSTKFDNMVGALILLNAITIGVQTDYAAKNVTEDFPREFQTIERIFLACFTLELILRLYVQKCRFFCEVKSIAWNYFDLCIVLAQLFEEILTLVARQVDMNTDMFTVLRILRILRIVRILRVVRVLHLISELRTIVSSIMGSLKSLGWTVVLLLLVIYIVGVYFTQATTDHLVELKLQQGRRTPLDTDLHYFFGSLGRTILSLWQSMSGGADWDTMAAPLINQVGIVTGILFAGFIAFALLALMNVVTGVFVQTALQSAKDEEDAFLVDQVLKLFDKAADKDTATITLDQIEEKFKDPAVAREWKSINVQPAEAKYLFNLLDIEETGEISFQEFLSGCLRLHGHSKSMDLLTVMQEARSASRVWDRMQKRWEAYHYNFQTTLEGIANAVTASATITSRLSLSVDTAVDVANQNQDKIGRLEKRIRSFESSLSAVRVAASNISKVNELIDSVIVPSSVNNIVNANTGNSGSGNRTPAESAEVGGTQSPARFGGLCTIDEV